MMSWIYKGSQITQADIGDDHKTCPHYSFVYVITNMANGRKYVGKKFLWSQRTLPPLKGQTRKRKVVKPSDWEKYYGSCKPLLADIKEFGKESFHREIIELYPDKREANFAELRFQIMHNVLDAVDENGNRIWYNENIDRIYYPSKAFGDRREREHRETVEQLTRSE